MLGRILVPQSGGVAEDGCKADHEDTTICNLYVCFSVIISAIKSRRNEILGMSRRRCRIILKYMLEKNGAVAG
jgi:hypothetical protein